MCTMPTCSALVHLCPLVRLCISHFLRRQRQFHRRDRFPWGGVCFGWCPPRPVPLGWCRPWLVSAETGGVGFPSSRDPGLGLGASAFGVLRALWPWALGRFGLGSLGASGAWALSNPLSVVVVAWSGWSAPGKRPSYLVFSPAILVRILVPFCSGSSLSTEGDGISSWEGASPGPGRPGGGRPPSVELVLAVHSPSQAPPGAHPTTRIYRPYARCSGLCSFSFSLRLSAPSLSVVSSAAVFILGLFFQPIYGLILLVLRVSQIGQLLPDKDSPALLLSRLGLVCTVPLLGPCLAAFSATICAVHTIKALSFLVASFTSGGTPSWIW
jgi:hypothetical protein